MRRWNDQPEAIALVKAAFKKSDFWAVGFKEFEHHGKLYLARQRKALLAKETPTKGSDRKPMPLPTRKQFEDFPSESEVASDDSAGLSGGSGKDGSDEVRLYVCV